MAASPSAVELARAVAHLADEKKAHDLVILDVSRGGTIDCFVIATATSSKHALVVAEEALRLVKLRGEQPWHLETASDWVCADFGDVVLHVFTREARDYYDLEHLWADAARIARTTAAPSEVSA